jgi:hypothetical protein
VDYYNMYEHQMVQMMSNQSRSNSPFLKEKMNK